MSFVLLVNKAVSQSVRRREGGTGRRKMWYEGRKEVVVRDMI